MSNVKSLFDICILKIAKRKIDEKNKEIKINLKRLPYELELCISEKIIEM